MEELAQLQNASASYDEIAETGSPADPLRFPDPRVGRAARVTATVYNPATNETASVPNIVFRLSSNDQLPERAYWIGRKLRKAIYGCVRSCTVLRLRDARVASWEVTSEIAAVKIMDWSIIRKLRGRHMEDPEAEIAAMQYIGDGGGHSNVMHAHDILADDLYLYCFMPYCTSGELFGFVERNGRFPEPEARYWFKQIVQGLYYLQKRGVCHRDMSLENLLVDQNTRCLVIDLGMSLRVPFANDDGSVTDVSAGTLRRLIRAQSPCGKPNYISPEVLLNQQPFDGFAIDLWAAGVILFIMLVGIPPFEWANDEDARFVMIARQHRLRFMLEQWRRPVSEDACDLLQDLLKADPRDRLTMIEVMEHRWVENDNVMPPAPPPNEGWRS